MTYEKEDTRVVKTIGVLYDAMGALLKKRSFKGITAKDICEEAMLSRPTFYSHFSDKYDLLTYWIDSLKPDLQNAFTCNSYEELEQATNHFLKRNRVVLKNILEDADDETMEILFDFVLSPLDLTMDQVYDEQTNHKWAVLAAFYAGGMVYYLYRHTNRRMPFEPMNPHLYEIMQQFRKWRKV